MLILNLDFDIGLDYGWFGLMLDFVKLCRNDEVINNVWFD